MHYIVLFGLLVMLVIMVNYTRNKTTQRDVILTMLAGAVPNHYMWRDVKGLTIIIWFGRILTIALLVATFRLVVAIFR